MDSKTKHRILGILVVVGLIVILLPFLQSGSELSPETAAIKTPPFPDQSVQVTAPTPAPTPTLSIAPTHTLEEVKQSPDDTIKTIHPSTDTTAAPTINNPILNKKVELPKPSTNPIKPTTGDATTTPQDGISYSEVPKPEPIIESAIPTPAPITKKVASITPTVKPKNSAKKIKRLSYAHTPIDNNGLFKLQNPAWIIQIGSFKNKANALRVVNQLRANGYSAFIQQTASPIGDNIRVFVGPENRQSTARELATRLENNMHLKAIVISYKPLALL